MIDHEKAAAPGERTAARHENHQHSMSGVNRLPNLENLRGEHISAYRAALAVDDRKRASKYLGKAYAVGEAIRRIRAEALVARVGLEWGAE